MRMWCRYNFSTQPQIIKQFIKAHQKPALDVMRRQSQQPRIIFWVTRPARGFIFVLRYFQIKIKFMVYGLQIITNIHSTFSIVISKVDIPLTKNINIALAMNKPAKHAFIFWMRYNRPHLTAIPRTTRSQQFCIISDRKHSSFHFRKFLLYHIKNHPHQHQEETQPETVFTALETKLLTKETAFSAVRTTTCAPLRTACPTLLPANSATFSPTQPPTLRPIGFKNVPTTGTIPASASPNCPPTRLQMTFIAFVLAAVAWSAMRSIASSGSIRPEPRS